MDKDEHIGKKILTYTFTKRLGRGAFGSVYAAFDTRTNKTVACKTTNNVGKVIPQHKLDEEPKLEELVQTEAAVLRKCRNENVIGLVEDFRTTRNIYICMEYCNGGDLEGYIKNKGGKLREDEALGFIKQILNGFKVWKNVM
ncbi:MAG: protein kinase family protein [Actinobacteria bacterium]|nr:protein kinase family protein [Actinomycetota bacterium]